MNRTVNPPMDAALAANSLTRLFASEIIRETVLIMIVSIASNIVLQRSRASQQAPAALRYNCASYPQ